MSIYRYSLEQDRRGCWSVIDGKTSLPAHHRNHVMTRMRLDEADAMTDLLNQLKRRRNPVIRPDRLPAAT